MIRAGILVAMFCVANVPAQGVAEGAAKAGQSTQETSVQKLIARMREREGAVKAATLKMVTRGSYPGGMTFEVTGAVRVLGTTHFHIKTVASFEDGTTVESETVKTPDGVWMREKDHVNGEVFTKMSPDLMHQLEQASASTGEGAAMPGGIGNREVVPVGSAVIEAMDKTYDLTVVDRRIDGEPFYVVAGDARAGAEGEAKDLEEQDLPTAARVELLVRQRDLVVQRMSHFGADGSETLRIEILDLILDPPLEEASFVLENPGKRPVIDVMDHLPAATQINALLERFAESNKPADNKSGAGKGGGKD